MKKNKLEKNKKELLKKFNEFRKKTYKGDYGGPSSYFHIESIKMYRRCKNKKQYEKLLANTGYIEKIYATLASWGMQRMGSEGLVDFKDLRRAIKHNKKDLVRLFGLRLYKLNDSDMKTLGRIFLNLRTMKSNSQFVGNSKLLHHLLPDIVLPMDRGHTLRFFCKHLPSIGYYKSASELKKKEKEIFIDVLAGFQELYKEIPKTYFKKMDEFDTSIPKIIDNAIMGNNW